MASGLFPFQSKASGSTRAKVTSDYGEQEAVIVKPKARHQATIVWLHDLNESGKEASEFVKSFSLYNVKWICPTAPSISNMYFGGQQARAWFKVNKFNSLRPDPDEIDGLKNAAAYVAGLLKDEPENVMKGVVGYGIGGALALHIASCYALGTYPIQMQAVVGINCWLPHYLHFLSSPNCSAPLRAAELPIFVTHNCDDNMVPFVIGKLSVSDLLNAGFEVKLKLINQDKISRSLSTNDHAIVFQMMTEISLWLTRTLELEGEQD